jgi:bifunctional ADP-heptose synthase (sugar kinase/adenylyltransferase)
MRILVIGDRIIDNYRWCKATRLCPEACAPVLYVEKETSSEGGAGLVVDQLRALFKSSNVVGYLHGSVSEKLRVFAERTLICRIDRDSFRLANSAYLWDEILCLKFNCEAIVISDYGKGTFFSQFAKDILGIGLPTFVDSKHNLDWWKGATFIFPNEDEHLDLNHGDYLNVIRKLGPRGCTVNKTPVPTKQQQVYDVSGAGDVFMAAFVYEWLMKEHDGYTEQELMIKAAEYANKAAGISVRHLGTYVVKPEELYE